MAPRTAALLLAAALAVAGCGDDDSGPEGDATTTSVTSVDADAGDDGTGDEPTDDAAASTTTSSAPDADVDAGAEDPPGGSDDDTEGAADDFVYVAELTGEGSGRAELVPGDAGELCVDMEVTGLGSAATDAHVHESQDGRPVVPIGAPTGGDGDRATWDDVCVALDDDVAEALAVDATQFHVRVHTADRPDGAVQGPLAFATIFDLELS